MYRLLKYFIILLILLIPSLFSSVGMSNFLGEPRIRIDSVKVDLEENEPVAVGDQFSVDVTMTNKRFLPMQGVLRVYLTVIGFPQKEIGSLNVSLSRCRIIDFLRGENTETFEIPCIIDWLDASWYQQTYNIMIIFYKEQLFGSLMKVDCSTIEGVQVISPFWEKNKLSIIQMEVPERLEDPQQDTFFVKGLVFNGGQSEMLTRLRIDLVEKPSAIPALDQIGLVPGMATILKELGDNENWEPIEPGGLYRFDIKCYLRDLDEKKENFYLTATIIVSINNKEYGVYTSEYYEIYHKQPFCREEGCWVLAGVVTFVILIAFCLLSISIRILYPMYRIKKIQLLEETNRMKKRGP